MATTVITDDALDRMAHAQGQGANPLAAAYFKIGEGGWEMDGISKVARTPDPALTDLDCLENPSNYPVQSRYYFQKNISGTSIQELGNGEVEITCSVSTGEANTDDYGNAPKFWEIGIFTADGVMLAYRTFNEQEKNSLRSLRHVFSITNQRG
jgi:hypothetical protein